MSVLAVIPARLGATRLPNKPMRLLGGVPLVVRVWERVRDLGVSERVVVATDAPEIVAAVHAAGGEAVLTSASHPSGTDRVAEVARRTDLAAFDVILNVQADEPFVSGEALRGAVAQVHRGLALGTAAAPTAPAALQNPNVVKVVCAQDGRALYFSRAPIPWLREESDRDAQAKLLLQHIGVYAYRRDALFQWVTLPVHPLEQVERLEQLRPLAAGLAMGVAIVAEVPDAGIDTEDDLARANARWGHIHISPV